MSQSESLFFIANIIVTVATLVTVTVSGTVTVLVTFIVSVIVSYSHCHCFIVTVSPAVIFSVNVNDTRSDTVTAVAQSHCLSQYNTFYYYSSPLWGYSVIIYNDNNYTIINYNRAKNIVKKYLHEFIYTLKNVFQSI